MKMIISAKMKLSLKISSICPGWTSPLLLVLGEFDFYFSINYIRKDELN
jgi:hypothetical protein